MKREPSFKRINTRKGWHEFYVARFNRTGSKQAEWMAMWYLILAWESGEIPLEPETPKKPIKKLVQANKKPKLKKAA